MLVAGSYRGIDAGSSRRSHARRHLFIDEIHTLVGAGAAEELD